MDPKPWRIAPYKKAQPIPRMAYLTEEGELIDEFSNVLQFDKLPTGPIKLFTSYDNARILVNRGIGESLCWNGEEIRWRSLSRIHRSGPQSRRKSMGDSAGEQQHCNWIPSRSDVSVLRIQFPDSVSDCLRHLAHWRDWLAGYGASPVGTTGGAAWSLLRATIRKPFWINSGDFPPFTHTMGGRVEIGSSGPGRYEGDIRLLDLPAAYATEIGRMKYGGKWVQASGWKGGFHTLDYWAKEHRSVFVHADVEIPEMQYGPLVNRPKRRISFLHSLCLNYYPRGGRHTNIWTLEELQAAESLGVKILKVHEVWAHMGGRPIFQDWWAAIEEGKRLPGFAKNLVKMTGNALWGRFAMDGGNGHKTIRKRNGKTQKVESKTLEFQAGVPPDHALSEGISGRIRAKLGVAMCLAGDNLISAHTDGAWILDRDRVANDRMALEWREKQTAIRLDILSPQAIRYWPTFLREPTVMLAGYPPSLSGGVFQRHWDRRYGQAH